MLPAVPRGGVTAEPVTLETVQRAAERVGRVARRTPLEHSPALSDAFGAPVHLKLECWQPTRSFKVRGAYNAISRLTAAERARGIVTASAGNHGQAVALAARELGARATVFLPADAPRTKQDRIRSLGAELRADAADYDTAERSAQEYAASAGAVFVHAYADPAVISGQGTVALEIVEQLPDVEQVIVPVGGGYLITGVGTGLKALRPACRVTGVQSVETRAMYDAFRDGAAGDVVITPTLADGLAGCTDEATYRRARRVTDDLVLVEETDIADAIRVLYDQAGITAEGSAAVAAAAVLTGRITTRAVTALIITCGNIDGARLARILEDR
ncbi:threonine ammonia-lyase [soil metagenome]